MTFEKSVIFPYTLVIVLPVALSFLDGCKFNSKENPTQADVKVAIPIPKPPGGMISELIDMIVKRANATKLADRQMSVIDTFKFFDLTDEEKEKIQKIRTSPSTVEKFTNRSGTYYRLESLGTKDCMNIQSTNGLSICFEPTVRIYAQFTEGQPKIDICNIEGISAWSTPISYNYVYGYFGDETGKEKSQVFAGPGWTYPKRGCKK